MTRSSAARSARCGVALATLSALGVLAGAPAWAGEIGHFAAGLVNIRDYVMPPEPGLYSSIYNYYYSTSRLNDADGRSIDSVTLNPGPGSGVEVETDVDVDIFVTVPSVLWVSPWKILGARYGAYIAPSIANSSVGASLAVETGRGIDPNTSSVGFGDLYVQPLWLDWNLPNWDFALGYGFYAPTGRYDVDTVTLPVVGSFTVEDSGNIGLGYWTHQFQGAISWYPWEHRGTAATAALTYEINSDKKGFDYTPGQRLSLNWGISQYLPLTDDNSVLFEIGPAGYSQWQVTDDTGSDAPSSGVKDQSHAVGAQLGLTVVPWNAALNFHYFHEFASEDRFQGDVFGLNLAWRW